MAAIRRRVTVKKKKLAQLLVANTGSPSPLSMQDLMLQAGYTESTARARHGEIVEAAREEPEVQDHLARLKRIREKMLDRIETTLPKTDCREAIVGYATIQKAITDLEGKMPALPSHELSKEAREELEEILRMNE